MRWMGNTISPACKRGGWGDFLWCKTKVVQSCLEDVAGIGGDNRVVWQGRLDLFSNQVLFLPLLFPSDWWLCGHPQVHPEWKVDSPPFDLKRAILSRDPLTDLGQPALGPFRDQLPQDLNVTFFFDYEKATVETIEIINTTNGEWFYKLLWRKAVGHDKTLQGRSSP